MPFPKLAFKAEIDLTYMGGIERGKRNPSLLVMARIADHFRCPCRCRGNPRYDFEQQDVGLVLSAGVYAGTRLLDITSGTRASLWLANLIDLDILGPDKHARRDAKFGTKGNPMERLIAFGALAYLALGLLSEAHAERIMHPTGGYSLDFPSGWAMEKKKSTYALTHSNGSSFEGTLAQLPPNVASVKVAALMARAAALAAGLCSKEPATEFELAGPGWNGSGFHCNNRIDGKSRPTQTIAFIVKIKSAFHQFFLFVPRQDWASNREQYLALFKSLRISS